MTGEASPGLPGWQELVAACAQAAATLPFEQVLGLADRALAVPDPSAIRHLQDRPPTPRFREAATAVVEAWRVATPSVTGETVAGMLQACAATIKRERGAETVDLVWTGPGTDTIHGSATSDVVVGLIQEAENALVLSTFASRRVAKVRDALQAAVARGVRITLILENENSNGQYQQAARDPFEGIDAEILEWPADRRLIENNWSPALHAKFVLVDEKALLITSANLTGFALDRNIEAGALIRGGPLPGRLLAHLRELTYDGVFAQVNRPG